MMKTSQSATGRDLAWENWLKGKRMREAEDQRREFFVKHRPFLLSCAAVTVSFLVFAAWKAFSILF